MNSSTNKLNLEVITNPTTTKRKLLTTKQNRSSMKEKIWMPIFRV